jgi:hypothetical protein
VVCGRLLGFTPAVNGGILSSKKEREAKKYIQRVRGNAQYAGLEVV